MAEVGEVIQLHSLLPLNYSLKHLWLLISHTTRQGGRGQLCPLLWLSSADTCSDRNVSSSIKWCFGRQGTGHSIYKPSHRKTGEGYQRYVDKFLEIWSWCLVRTIREGSTTWKLHHPVGWRSSLYPKLYAQTIGLGSVRLRIRSSLHHESLPSDLGPSQLNVLHRVVAVREKNGGVEASVWHLELLGGRVRQKYTK